MPKPKVTLTGEDAALSRKDRFRAGGFEKARGFIVDRFLGAAKQPPLVNYKATLKVVYKCYGNWSAKFQKLVLPAGDRSGEWDCMAFSRKSTRRSVFAARPKGKAPSVYKLDPEAWMVTSDRTKR